MKFVIVMVCLVGMSQARPSWSVDWEQWKLDNEKNYAVQEEEKRQMIWQQNLQLVTKHNYEYDLGLHAYQLGMNNFADMTNEEFKALYLGEMPSLNADICNSSELMRLDSHPATVDWRTKGYVTPVKNQEQCGSCWAFSTTGSLEGQHFKKTGNLVSLSEQNLVDCSTAEGDQGCSGGLMDNAFEYILKSGGVDTEKSYPYHAKKAKCQFDEKNVGATLIGCVDIPSKSEDSLLAAVTKIGPISVAIDAGHSSFQLYKSGVYYEPQCSETRLDHGVLAVGYGTENGMDYWLVKNSWGNTWGNEEGYIKMSRNRSNNCGIATSASYPVV